MMTWTASVPGARFSADDIADAIGQHRPTDEQRAVIEAPLAPALVVAGAGSGKTETMSARVLWLVANGFVLPEQVLGLTFTRKAAAELSQRVRERLITLGASGLMARGGDAGPLVDAFTQPTVSTYNAFASTLYRDHAVLIGRDPDGAVLGEASAWQVARELVVSSHDERLAALDLTVDTVTRAVIALAHSLAEHSAGSDDLRALAQTLMGLADLPPGGRTAYPDVDEVARVFAATLPIADLIDRFQERKAREGLVEFSDQVNLALAIIDRHPEVTKGIRDRYRVILLDEYQDTNVAQARLLESLFGGLPVTAVGDPHQSIYGWRGASASNLDDFARRFASDAASPVARFSLSMSWRNGRHILEVANALVEPLTAHGGVAVERLVEGPRASAEGVELLQLETVEDEADGVARWLAARLAETPVGAGSGATDDLGRPLRPSAALLMRSRTLQPVFLAALRRHGVPFHVLGIGGLLAEPEIADLVSALAVVDDPAAGTELVRLLAGPRWRIGVADLDALHGVASWLRDRDLGQRSFSPEVIAKLREQVSPSDGVSLVDALDFVATAPDTHGQLQRLTPLGRERLTEAGKLFARLRARTAVGLPDLVAAVEHELRLDIEVMANPGRVLGSAPREAFLDALDGYLGLADHATLGGFLSWLREAEWRDNLSPRSEDPEPGTVQVLTIHGAKGLEWDHVAVPRFVADELPAKARDTKGWLSLGVLPYELRGDSAELPVFPWRGAETRKELLSRRSEFVGQVAAHHEREERRLAYVAVTRARHRLLLTGSFWSTQQKPRGVSLFLLPLIERGIVPAVPAESVHDENPMVRDDESQPWWPGDPLGRRRATLERAAARVRSASAEAPSAWHGDVELLLAEREERQRAGHRVPVPVRVAASTLKDFITDPEAMAARLRRPMPQRPYRATRLGTIFHRWVEQRYGLATLADSVDGIDLIDDELAGDDIELARLIELQQTFARSPWAQRRPIEVERELHLVIENRILVCKIDAVYPLEPAADGSERVEIVDWKTGRAPEDEDDRRAKELQLAAYRLAYANWRELSLQNVEAAFYFVADDAVLRPTSLPDEAELRRLWRFAMESETLNSERSLSAL
jgi:DNA helicase II / ATP-dependent DNA helicase PcrA